MSELLKKYGSIDQSKLNEPTIKILNRVKSITVDFTADDEKNNKIAEQVLNEIMKKNPDAVKIVKTEPKPKPAPKKTSKATAKAKPNGKTKVATVKTTTNTVKSSGNNIMSIAKEIQKTGESWKDAMERAKQVLKERKEGAVTQKKTELDKLYALVKTRKELKGFANSDIDRDSRRVALPRGRRVSKDGNVYYENRENRIDRLAPNYPKDMPLLENGGTMWTKESIENELTHYKNLLRNIDKYPKYSKKNVEKVISELENKLDKKDFADGGMTNLTMQDVSFKNGGNVSNTDKLIKELQKLQRDLISSRLSTYREGDTSDEEIARQRERESKIARFNEVLKELRESDAKLAEGGSLPFMTDPNFGNFQNTGMFEDGGSVTAVTDAIFYPNAKKGKISTSFGDKTKEGLFAMITNVDYDAKEISNAIFEYNENSGKIKTGFGNKTKDGLTEMLKNVRNTFENGGSTSKYKVGQKFYDTRYDRVCEIVPSNYDGLVTWKRFNKSGTEFENDTLHSLVENQFDYLVDMGAYQISKDSYELGGAFMTTDLAGHTGGSFGVGNEMPLSGVSGTHYTGLVGETGAMSSGELFENGGAMMQNQQVIDGASQPYVITEAFGNPAQHLAKGGSIKDQYEGRTDEDSWNNLSKQQRQHFLYDHVTEIEEYKKIKRLPSSEIIKAYNSDWSSLDKDIKNRFSNHVREGQYASGGSLGKSLFVAYSSYFDSNKYDEEKIMSALKSIGAKNIHLENDNGMFNLPEVVVFNGDKNKATDALNEAFDTDYVLVYEKDWRTKKMADGGSIKPFEYEKNGSKIMVNGTKSDIKDMYLDYFNNFLTIEKFAEHYGISKEQAKKIISQGRMYEREDGYLAKGGFIGNVEFNVGDTVWQKDEKRYATVMNNYGDPINGDGGDVRLDTTGNTAIFTYDKEYKNTGYNLIKVGEKGDIGKFTPTVLDEMKKSANRLIDSRRQSKDKEGVAYYQEVYKRLLDGEFDSMTGAKSTASSKKGSRDYTYVPNADVKDLSVVMKGQLRELKGSDILDGVYVKNSAKGSTTKKVDANAVFAKILKDAKEAKQGKSKKFDANDLKKLNLDTVEKLVEAGYSEQQIRNVIFGYAFDNEIVAENELEYDNGIFSYEESYIAEKVNDLVQAKKNNEFVLGIEYPDFDWQGIIKKYKISTKSKELVEERSLGGLGRYENFYEVFSGENIVLGHTFGYKSFDEDGKLKGDYIEEGKKVADPTKQNAWQKEREQKAGFNGGYWYVASSKIEIIDDVLKTLLAQKDGYCKEVSFYDNSFAKTLNKNKIAFADGGFMNDVYADGGQAAEENTLGYFKDNSEMTSFEYSKIINDYFNKWNSIKTDKDSENFKKMPIPMFGTYKEKTILDQIEHFEKIGIPFYANETMRNMFKKEVSKNISNIIARKGYFAEGGNLIPNVYYFYDENENEITFNSFEEAYEQAKENKQQKFRDNLGGEYFVNYAKGGNIENFSDNQRMIMNQNVELEHHHEELEDILEDRIEIPAWVVAKMATATQSVSDTTHYLDGQKELREEEEEDNEEYVTVSDYDYSKLDPRGGDAENINVVEPINVSAVTKAELTKKFTDDALGNLKGFLKGMEGINLREDYTFDYKDEQYEIEPIINSNENGVSNAVFTIFNGDGEEVGEVAYSREDGKQKFTANSEFFSWNNTKFADGGFMNDVYADGGQIRVGDKFKSNWTDSDNNKGFDVIQIIKQNVTSGKDFKTKVMVTEIVDSSNSKRIGLKQEEYKPNFKKNLEYGLYEPLTTRMQTFSEKEYEKGGGLKKYIDHSEIKTVTVNRNGKEIKYKGDDVLNGVNVLANGGDISSKANYVPKRDVVEVELNDGSKVKPVNGYWVKKRAEPIGAEPTPINIEKSKSKIGETYIKKGLNGWKAETNVDDFDGYDWRISTFKTSRGDLLTSAKGGKSEESGTRGIVIFSYKLYEDPYHTLEVSKPSRLTEKVVSEQHEKGLAKFKKFMETGVFRAGGKISNFDKLSDKVAKEYEGKPVKNKFQEEYGKFYSKEEAQEVGDKVAGKVKATQSDKMFFGGVFKDKFKPKTYVNLDDKMVMTKDGKAVQVVDQTDDILLVVDANSIGSGVRPHKINISEIDPTSYELGGETVVKKQSKGTENLKKSK